MPLYEYECESCHRRTEKIQKFSDAPLTECPHCSGRLEKTITAPAVSFKGGGWYADLYSSSKPKSSGGDSKSSGDSSKSSSSDSSSASSTTSSSESKPASAPAASSSTTKSS